MIVHSKKEWENLLKEALGDAYEMLCAHGLQVSALQHIAIMCSHGRCVFSPAFEDPCPVACDMRRQGIALRENTLMSIISPAGVPPFRIRYTPVLLQKMLSSIRLQPPNCNHQQYCCTVSQPRMFLSNYSSNFVPLHARTVCGQATHNVVFAHRAILPLLRNVRSCAVATGLSLGSPGTTLGNKGGVGISFDIGATSCVFVNSHLAAHQNNVRERNEHFFTISQGLVRELGGSTVWSRGGGSPPLAKGPPPSTAPEPGSEEPTLGTLECDSRGFAKGGDWSSGVGISSSAVAPPDAVTGRGCCDGGVQDRRIELRGDGGNGSGDGNTNRTLSALVWSSSEAAALAASSTLSPSPNETKEAQPERSRAEAQPRINLAGFGGVTADACSTPPLTPDPQIPSNFPYGSTTPPSPSRSLREKHEHKHALQAGRGRTEAKAEGAAGDFGRKTLPQVFDRVVWAGDLNYRINAPRPVADLLLSKGMHEVLLNNEQLSLERGRDRDREEMIKIREGGGAGGDGDRRGLFSGYSEGPLNFRPTYKFDTGTDTYDTSSKQRVPAWTDRILYSGAGACKKGEGEVGASTSGMQLRAYRSVGELKTSDHRPVLASFVMQFDLGDGGDGGSERAAVTNQTSSQVCSIM